MIVASFYAYRYDKWGIDYHKCLAVLEASCERLGLQHVVISDKQQGKFKTFVTDLPENLMLAMLKGQRDFIAQLDEPALLVGADCIITKDPTGMLEGADAVFTVFPFGDCCLNTGAMWVRDRRCAPIWDAAVERNPVEWGEDQMALRDSLEPVPNRADAPIDGVRMGLRVRFVDCRKHNWAPDKPQDKANGATVVHFRGTRKPMMKAWGWLNLALNVP